MSGFLLRGIVCGFVLLAAYKLFGNRESAFWYGAYAELLCLILGRLL
jgi:hypothetical protein